MPFLLEIANAWPAFDFAFSTKAEPLWLSHRASLDAHCDVICPEANAKRKGQAWPKENYFFCLK